MTDQSPSSKHAGQMQVAWEGNTLVAILDDIRVEVLSDGLIGACEDAREIIRTMVANGILTSAADRNIAISLAERLGIPQCDAELIVMTEIRSALEDASLEGALAIGFKGKRWLTSNALGVCPTCEANKAQGLIRSNIRLRVVTKEHLRTLGAGAALPQGASYLTGAPNPCVCCAGRSINGVPAAQQGHLSKIRADHQSGGRSAQWSRLVLDLGCAGLLDPHPGQ